MFCVGCGVSLVAGFDFKAVCKMCSSFFDLDVDVATWVPSVCGDAVCYLDDQGMPNLDGNCSHESDFEKAFPFLFIY